MSPAPPPGEAFRSGFVSLIGRPNSGKSTLLNALLGQKVAIVADKPQTTRAAVQGVLTLAGAQIVFLDTPGIHKADSPLNKRLMHTVRMALEERDALVLVVDAARAFAPEDQGAVDLAAKPGAPVILALNKIDLLQDKSRLLPLLDRYRGLFQFAAAVPISAARGDGLHALRQEILACLPQGPAYFPENHVTDQPDRFLAAELIREKILEATRQEVPHAAAVLVDRWQDTPKLTRIYATIHVEREGQKAIVIGAGGSTLKQIGSAARREMERLFGVHVYLDLHVRVEPGWREQARFLDAVDWRHSSRGRTEEMPEE